RSRMQAALGAGELLEANRFMTWKRVATALVLIPVVVGLVLFTPTWVVAMVTSAITILALWEYFALGEAIGHRAYRVWTALCSIFFVIIGLPSARAVHMDSVFDRAIPHSADSVFFLFLLGLTAMILWSKRPLVEALPAAGISASALLLVAFPLSFAVRLHD